MYGRGLLLGLWLAAVAAPAALARAEPAARRPVPDYDGRSPAPPAPQAALVWTLRLGLLPVDLALEYGLRRPVVGLIRVAERYEVVRRVKEALLFRDGRSGIIPTAWYEFGLRPSVGVYSFNHDVLVPGQSVNLRAALWSGWTRLAASSRTAVTRRGTVTLDAGYSNRPDHVFYGTGPDTMEEDKSYYRLRLTRTRLGCRITLGPHGRLASAVVYQHDTFGPGEEPSVAEVFSATAVPGLAGYDLVAGRLRLELDSRDPRAPGSGARLALGASGGVDPGDVDLRLLRWSGEGAVFLDLGAAHVLGVRAYVGFVERLGPAPVPLTELVVLGGAERMRGFLEGRFHGRSGIVFTADYRYPIWPLLDADLFASAGNVFDGHLADFAFERLFLCFGLGLRTTYRRDVALELLVGFGTSRLDDPELGVDHVRFAVGVNTGF